MSLPEFGQLNMCNDPFHLIKWYSLHKTSYVAYLIQETMISKRSPGSEKQKHILLPNLAQFPGLNGFFLCFENLSSNWMTVSIQLFDLVSHSSESIRCFLVCAVFSLPRFHLCWRFYPFKTTDVTSSVVCSRKHHKAPLFCQGWGCHVPGSAHTSKSEPDYHRHGNFSDASEHVRVS